MACAHIDVDGEAWIPRHKQWKVYVHETERHGLDHAWTFRRSHGTHFNMSKAQETIPLGNQEGFWSSNKTSCQLSLAWRLSKQRIQSSCISTLKSKKRLMSPNRNQEALEAENVPMQPGVMLEYQDCPETPDSWEQKVYRSYMSKLQIAATWIRCGISYSAAQLAWFCASISRHKDKGRSGGFAKLELAAGECGSGTQPGLA
jgi:hypothetical protein